MHLLKITFSCFLFGLLFYSCSNANGVESSPAGPYTITGTFNVPGVEKGPVVLFQFDPVSQEKTTLDTADISSEGRYALQFDFSEPDLFRVDFPGSQYVMLVVGEGQSAIELNVTGEDKKVEIKGSPDSEKLLGYEEFRAESNARLVRPAYDAMREAGEEGANPVEENEAVRAYVKASNQHRKELLDYTSEHIGTSIALYGSMLRWTGDDEVARLEKLVGAFKSAHPDLTMTRVMEDKLARYKKVALGVKAPAIEEKNPEGQIVSLDEVKGKVTLVDFWASWCGPCIRQIPELKKAYEKYHDQGFEIFGVSVDSRKERWKAAIEKHGLPWPNVSDVKGWASAPAAAYNVTFIPFNVLLDEKGTIIAKNLHSVELDGKLAELLESK